MKKVNPSKHFNNQNFSKIKLIQEIDQWILFSGFKEWIWCFDELTLFKIYFLIAQDLSKSIKKITTFLGINVSDSEINQISWKSSFREMKNNAAKENCDPNKTICALTSNKNLVFRKGKSERDICGDMPGTYIWK